MRSAHLLAMATGGCDGAGVFGRLVSSELEVGSGPRAARGEEIDDGPQPQSYLESRAEMNGTMND